MGAAHAPFNEESARTAVEKMIDPRMIEKIKVDEAVKLVKKSEKVGGTNLKGMYNSRNQEEWMKEEMENIQNKTLSRTSQRVVRRECRRRGRTSRKELRMRMGGFYSFPAKA